MTTTKISKSPSKPFLKLVTRTCKIHKNIKLEAVSNSSKSFYYCRECYKIKHLNHLKAEAKKNEQKINARFKQSGIPKRFENASFDNYVVTIPKQNQMLDVCKQFLTNFQSSIGLIFIGKSGTGKNHIAVSLIKHIIFEEQKTGLIIKASKIVRSIKETWNGCGMKESQVINEYTSTDLLVIDEIGVQYGAPFGKKILSEIIDDRYEDKKPTILITNHTLKELSEILNDPSVDRFKENKFHKTVITFDWNSYRGTGGQNG